MTSSAAEFWFDEAAADRVVEFFERFLRHTKGRWAGARFELMDWQRDQIIRPLFGWKRKDGTRRYRRAYIEVPRKNGKALAVDTPILTARGWVQMGDIRVGDEVYGPDGLPTRVIAVSEVFTGHDCYEVVFSDGQVITADADHLWAVHDRYRERVVIVDTKTMAGNFHIGNRPTHNERRYSVRVPAPLRLPERELPIDPYLLGAWLGDGDTSAARMTSADPEVVEAFAARYDVRPIGKYQYAVNGGLRRALRELGVLGNKHIPEAYLLASEEQRMELLRGLMDTDGCVIRGSGIPRCELTTTNERLALDALQLVRSLGWKATLRKGRATLNGRDCGVKYRLSWNATADRAPFRLQRKASRLLPRTGATARSLTIQVVDVRRVPSVPTRCIQVARADGMYLAGRGFIPTHNSTLSAGIALYLLFADNEPGAEIYSAAADREQAAIVFETAKQMVLASPALRKRCEVYKRSIVVPKTGSSYKVLSADAPTKHGLNAHGVIFDELHAQPNRELWDVLTTATGAREQPLVVAITTAGYDRNSICWEQHEYARKVMDGIIDDPSFFAFIAAADEDDDWTDPAVWAKANPGLGQTVKLDYLEQEAKRAKEVPAYQNTFRRLHLNQWTQQESRWLDLAAWDATAGIIAEESLSGRPCFVGLDLSTTTDLTAMALLFPPQADGEPYAVLPRFFLPKEGLREREQRDRVPYSTWAREGFIRLTEGNVIDYQAVREQLHRDAQRYKVVEVAYDPWNATQLALQLQDDGFTVVQVRQGFATLSAPTKELMRLVVGGLLRHGGNPVLRWQADSMVVAQDPAGNIKPNKAKSSGRIDGMVALIMALDRAMRHEQPKRSVYEERGILTI
ncbi:MAG: terminase [Firmicutes bacterium]|nr:terminase [Bacillota bacterium]MBE3590833.1 terminase [Bacillota bacterium]